MRVSETEEGKTLSAFSRVWLVSPQEKGRGIQNKAYLSETSHPASVTLPSAVSDVKELLLWVGLGYGAEVLCSNIADISYTKYAQQVARMFARTLWGPDAPELLMHLRHGKGTRA